MSRVIASNLVLPSVAGVVALIIGIAAWVALSPQPSHTSRAMLNASGAQIGGPFELTSHTGDRVTSSDVIDRPTLIYFGYTFCPDVCPIDTQILAETVDLLAEQKIDVKPVFITVDPARDTPEELAPYAEAMHPQMIALTGSDADIRAVADAYKVFYSRQDMPGSAAEYLMNHSAYTYLMLPGDELAAVFRRDFSAAQIAEDVATVLASKGL